MSTTRDSLQHVAIHIVARARSQASGRFSLRITPGGFGTPEFGDTLRRVRVSSGTLLVESDAPGAASSLAVDIDGATLAELAAAAAVDLDQPLDVGHDTTAVGDPAARLTVDPDAAALLAGWFRLSHEALDRLVATLPAAATPTLPRLWPEHFDVALDAECRPGVRANFGASAGDGFHDEPYLYVGPWTSDRPGGGDYWNAPFGAVLAASDVPNAQAALAFFAEGQRRLGN